jgi:alpha,alpha-trehalose phosphorylase
MSHIVTSSGYDPARLLVEEALFHTANGYLGVRAAFEEGYAPGLPSVRGSYINAFYDVHEIRHPEKLYGFPEVGERMLAVTDAQGIELLVDGERMLLEPGSVEDFERRLDMDAGIASRSFTWRAASGKRLALVVRRLCSLARPWLFAVEYRVRAIDDGLSLRLVSRLDGDVANHYDASDPRLAGSAFKSLDVIRAQARVAGLPERGELYVESRTRGTRFLLVALGTVQSSASGVAWEAGADSASAWAELRAELLPGEELVLSRKTVYADSIRRDDPAAAARRASDEIAAASFDELAAEQAEVARRFWRAAEVDVEGDPETAEGLRFALFQLLQAAPREARSSIAAKGLSGEGYEGHYFWDCEIYLVPFYTYTCPELARALLLYRWSILEGARTHAREMGQARGAAFPWRTIAGRECSAYYPSGSAQYHINADIAYACWRYYEATDDLDFVAEAGAELLFETARTWMEIGHFLGDEFRIEAVTGPDEYTCLVDNNFYTNAMARFNLEKAAEARRLLRLERPDALADIDARLGLCDEEAAGWERAARAMYLPYDAERDLTPQDDGFLKKAAWDLGATPLEEFPLLLHYHHLALRRRQVCKQADVVLAQFLLPDAAPGSAVRNSYDYYERITTHDSSLSYAIFAAMAARLGDAEKAYRYFLKTSRLDLDDTQGNTKDGIHAACMGGSWLALVFGFGGFVPKGEIPAFWPRLPERWDSMMFELRYRGRVVRVRVERRSAAGEVVASLELLEGATIGVELYGERAELSGHLVAKMPTSGDHRGSEGCPLGSEAQTRFLPDPLAR